MSSIGSNAVIFFFSFPPPPPPPPNRTKRNGGISLVLFRLAQVFRITLLTMTEAVVVVAAVTWYTQSSRACDGMVALASKGSHPSILASYCVVSVWRVLYWLAFWPPPPFLFINIISVLERKKDEVESTKGATYSANKIVGFRCGVRD